MRRHCHCVTFVRFSVRFTCMKLSIFRTEIFESKNSKWWAVVYKLLADHVVDKFDIPGRTAFPLHPVYFVLFLSNFYYILYTS